MRLGGDHADRAGLALCGVLLAATPFLGWLAYDGAQGEGGLDALPLFVGELFCGFAAVGLAASAGLARLLAGRWPRPFVWAGAGYLALLFVFAVCAGAGGHRRRSELASNLRVAEEIAAAVEGYCGTHGDFPGSLDDLKRPDPPLVLRRGEPVPLDYAKSAGAFRLSFSRGWYIYEYAPPRPGQPGGWRRLD